MIADKELFDLYRTAVFLWLDKLAAAPNQKQARKFMTITGIQYVFMISREDADALLTEWRKQNIKK